MAAYALLVLGGKTTPSKEDVEKLLTESGVKPDADKAAALIKSLGETPFHEHVAGGLSKMASMGTATAAPAAGGAAAAEEKPKEEEAKKSEEEDVNMGGLFDDD